MTPLANKNQNTANFSTEQEFINDDIQKILDLCHEICYLFLKNKYPRDNLAIFMIRVIFCAFAEDTGLFEKDSFTNFIAPQRKEGFDPDCDLSARLQQLFSVLNLPPEVRNLRQGDYIKEVMTFPYVNGNLFEEEIVVPRISQAIHEKLQTICTHDWAKVSPDIFGAMFQSISNQEARRHFGAHYTSEENILKIINPLFMDELRAEFQRVRYDTQLLEQFHTKIANLKFLDPACGCGNFLIVSYRELRKLELDILRLKFDSPKQIQNLELKDLCRVSINQFYGIELNSFPCAIARASMWMLEHQMNNLVSQYFGKIIKKLPLTNSAQIVEANALQIDWEEVIPATDLNYIFGNPPFIGARVMAKEQKQDLFAIFKDSKSAGNFDYVCCWFKKAASMQNVNPKIKAAFVATNSIAQGEQPAILWQTLHRQGIEIDFAHRTFKWANEAKGKAAVHCVIIGFSKNVTSTNAKAKFIVDADNKSQAQNINGYLFDAPNIYLESRSKPLCQVPLMAVGNMPIDNGYYLFTAKEMQKFLEKEPQAKKYFHLWFGSEEFINNKPRYCLWLGDCSPDILQQMPECLKRIEAVKQYRLNSKSEATKKLAQSPTKFNIQNMPERDYLVIPRVSSERRLYLPIGFIAKKSLAGDALHLIPEANLYHFGILTSVIHNIWLRAFAGRLKSDYRYSKEVIYNNFPWPDVNKAQETKIAELAQKVLESRKQFAKSSLADLYDPLTMPKDLLKVHQELDFAVLESYNYSQNLKAEQILQKLLVRYQQLLQQFNC